VTAAAVVAAVVAGTDPDGSAQLAAHLGGHA
jgi:hypothetical protein